MKRIVVIGDNSERWVEGYLGVATSENCCLMDKLIPEKNRVFIKKK